jgi:hypothetical protein
MFNKGVFVMSNKSQLLQSISPILDYIKDKEIDAKLAEGLKNSFPIESKYMQQIKLDCKSGIDEGWLCPRDGTNLSYGRLVKTSRDTNNFGIDTVDMKGQGPGHLHPLGEIDLCFSLEGNPTFDGNTEGWTVYPPNTWHIPTVTNGRMVILYFLPDGAIKFGPKPN